MNKATRHPIFQGLDEFSHIEQKPIGTASLAQVHKATLYDGSVVALKVQHPRVKANSFIDMTTMEILVKTMDWIFPEFSFIWLAEETKINLPLELDFVNEGKNAERISKMLGHLTFLKVCSWRRYFSSISTIFYLVASACDYQSNCVRIYSLDLETSR